MSPTPSASDGGITGAFRQPAKGEVRQYSEIFAHTRNLALQRIVGEAQSVGANAVVGIKTSILPFGGTGGQEMFMLGTAAHHDMPDPHYMLPAQAIIRDKDTFFNAAKSSYGVSLTQD